MFIYTGFENSPKYFNLPEEVAGCYDPSGLESTFNKIESWLDRGRYAAGFLSYEAGAWLNGRVSRGAERRFPLVCMGSYGPPAADGISCFAGGGYKLSGVAPSMDFGDYSKKIRRIREYIADGDVYQITFCMKMRFNFEGSAAALFTDLARLQPVPYPAFIDTGEFKVLSLSPELFVRKRGRDVLTKPMKGTWPRGEGPLSDLAARFRLKFDEKNRAENLMITDLLRNDLGRIGSDIRVKRLFEVSGYRTLYQMTSTIGASVERDKPLREVFAALFPSGSVTGAPKLRAMEIIEELESEDRHIYTGAIGYITPGRDMVFSVPIRTLLIKGEKGEMGVGGGIIWDSTPRGEWEEGMLKSRFLFDCARGA